MSRFPLLKFSAIPLLSAALTGYCHMTGYLLQMQVISSVVFAGIFFTFAITIGTANRRRFEALDEIAALKSHILNFAGFFMRHHSPEKLPLAMDGLRTFFPTVRKILLQSETRVANEDLVPLDGFFTELLNHIVLLREYGLSPPECARLLQWRQEMLQSFERLLTIKEYNTPLILKRFNQGVLLCAIFILSPQFASLGLMGVVTAPLLTLMVLALLRIQEMIEDPFGAGLDHIHFPFIERIQNRLVL